MLKKIGCIAGQVKTLLLEKDYIHVYQLITSSEIIYLLLLLLLLLFRGKGRGSGKKKKFL
jgi:hypothetical protein